MLRKLFFLIFCLSLFCTSVFCVDDNELVKIGQFGKVEKSNRYLFNSNHRIIAAFLIVVVIIGSDPLKAFLSYERIPSFLYPDQKIIYSILSSAFTYMRERVPSFKHRSSKNILHKLLSDILILSNYIPILKAIFSIDIIKRILERKMLELEPLDHHRLF